MTRVDCEDRLDELARQVRWLRHAIERLLAVLGLLCGAGLASIIARSFSG
jgi:hypothetical protein